MRVSNQHAGMVLLAVLALTVTACSSTEQSGELQADYPSYTSLDALATASPVVARLTVTSSVRESTRSMAGHDVAYTLRPAKVTEVLAGGVSAGQTISLIRPGRASEPMVGMRDVEPSKEYVLFLEVHPGSTEAEVVGGDEGIFEPAEDGTSFMSTKFGTVTASALQSAVRKAHP